MVGTEEPSSGVVVTAPDGRSKSLAQFIDELSRRSPKPVTAIAEDAGLSRATFYLIRDKGQQPGLLTLASLLSSLGGVVRVPDKTRHPDLEVTIRGAIYRIDVKQPSGEIRRERRALQGLLAAARAQGRRTPMVGAAVGPAAGAAAGWLDRRALALSDRERLYKRLRDALERLDEDGLRQVAEYAEELASQVKDR